MSVLLSERRLPAVKDPTLRARVVDLLKDAIFSGKLEPGEALVELRLARELQVSQATVREALLELEQHGLVVRVPNRGTTVTRFSPEEIGERVRIRVVLEAMAWTEAAACMDAPRFAELDRRVEVLRRAMASSDVFERVQADLEFHSFVWEQSHNQTLVRMLHQLTAQLFAFASILRKRGRVSTGQVANSHEDVVLALRSRDPAVIQQAVRQHVQTSYERFLAATRMDGQ